MKRYNVEQKANESLETWYRRLAKAADQRLVRIEGASHENHFRGVKKWAYKSAMRNVKKWSGQDATRFNTKPPEDPEKMMAKIKDMQAFIESATSTKAGIKEFYMKRTKTVNKKYGTNFTWEELATYYESEQNDLWDSIYGSKTALRTIAAIQENADKIIPKIKEAKEKNMKISDLNESANENWLDLDTESSLILQNVYDALDNNNLKIEDLF